VIPEASERIGTLKNSDLWTTLRFGCSMARAAARSASVLISCDRGRLEGELGEIPALGAREMPALDIFGSGVSEFLMPSGGTLTTVTTCQGIALGPTRSDNLRTLLGIE
jgi:hypothetical protein